MYAKAKKKIQKPNLAHFGLKSSKPAIENCEDICRIFLLLCRKSSIRRFPTSRILAIRHLRFVFKACIRTLASYSRVVVLFLKFILHGPYLHLILEFCHIVHSVLVLVCKNLLFLKIWAILRNKGDKFVVLFWKI